MASQSQYHVIDYRKLETKFFTGHVQHTTFRSDASQGRRRVEEVESWYRGREIGRGTFGTVFLERSVKGEYRAVKEIAKDKSRKKKVDYRRELMAMAILANLKHDALFVQLFGWYESDDYVHIAMEYISHGHLRNYLEVERSENEAKAITRQLLEGLVVIHQEGFAHRDLKPENIFVVFESPVWVKIGDFGLAKLARNGTAFCTQAFSPGYSAPEMWVRTIGDSSEYTNAVDIWAVGCIAHEMLTWVLPFRDVSELSSYCTRPEFPRNSMLLKNISRKGIEVVESMLALPPERRVTAKEALDSEWLRLGDEGQERPETQEDSASLGLPEVPAPSGAEVTDGDSLPGNSKEGFHSRGVITVDAKDRRTTEAQLLERYPDASSNRKRYANIDDDVRHILILVLKEIQKSTNNPFTKRLLSYADAVHMLLSRVISMDIRDSAGNTPLHVAVSLLISLPSLDDKTSPNTLRALVASGADINTKNSKGETPLFLAVSGSSSEVSTDLLELGANIEEPDLDGARPLIVAVRKGGAALVELLLKHGAFPRTIQVKQKFVTPLHEAAESGSDAICQLILQTGTNVNARNFLERTPLHYAVIYKHLVVAGSLISAGADVEARDYFHRTALSYAIVAKSVPLVKLLLDHGANPDAGGKWVISPRKEAARANVPGVVAMLDRVAGPALLKVPAPQGAEAANGGGSISTHTNVGGAGENLGVAVISRRQIKPLAVNEPSTHSGIFVNGQAEEASVSRYPDAPRNRKPHANIDPDVKWSLESVLKEIQKSTNSPQKPMLSGKDSVHMLLSGAISMDIRDSAGNTPLHVAVNWLCMFYPRTRIVPSPLSVLVASKADIDAKNSEGKTPLFLAVSRSSSTITRKLLELGANAEEPDLDGVRPLMRAVERGSRTLAALLLNHGVFTGTVQVKQRAVTPLHTAARLESDAICRFILQRGANVNARDFMEQTPLHGAVILGRLVVAGSLIAAGADVGARDNLQRTALVFAVARNSAPLVKLLLDHGANPDVVDKWGASPRQAAVAANVPEIVAMFDRARVTGEEEAH